MAAPDNEVKQKNPLISAWVSTTYFAEGFPYMIVRWLAGIYFTDIGMKEAVIGYMNWFGIPWNFKFLWAPLVDLWGSKRGWMIRLELLIAIFTGALALLTGLGPASQGAASSQPLQKLEWDDLAHAIDPTTGLSHLSIIALILLVLLVLAALSATHDVSIDAFYIEGLPDRTQQAAYSGLRVMAYRGAVLFVKFVLVAFTSWVYNFGIAALVMLALFVFHSIYLPRFPGDGVHQKRGPLLGEFTHAFSSYLQQPRIALIIAFIITYKLGDEILFAMNSPFLMRELHVTKPQLSVLSGMVGTIATIVGTFAGAYWIKRVGLKRAIWPLTLAMNINIWAYVWLAWTKPDAGNANDFLLISVLNGYEWMSKGLGDAGLTVFLLYTCKPEFKAAHYAVGSAIMSVGSTFLGGFTGKLVEQIGYTNVYVMAFCASIPGMILLFWLPIDELQARGKG